MKRGAFKIFLFLYCLGGFFFSTHAQLIQLISTSELRYDAVQQSKICKGNVLVLHEGIYIRCDSAILLDKENTMQGFGNVRIYQPDTFTMTGKTIFYDGKTKMARVSGDVVLSDNQMTLTTPFIDYDTRSKIGSYAGGGTIVNGADVLSSKTGQYNSISRVAFFKGNVVLVNPDYTMKGDTLQYNTSNSTAFFFGPTIIESKENRIECRKGYYQTRQNLASFSDRASLFSSNGSLSADSLFYNRNTGNGKAYKNIVVEDTIEGFTLYGQFGDYYEKEKFTMLSGQPMGEKLMEKDTFYFLADSFFYYSDTLEKKLITYHNTKIFSSQFSGMSDTFIYYVSDSFMVFLNEPVVWNENNQITGDTIRMFLKNKSLDRMHVRNNSFVASLLEEDRFDQLSGTQLFAYFQNGKLSLLHVEGQGQSVYHSRDNDTGAYSGINAISSGNIKIHMDSSGIRSIRFYPTPSPEGTLYPPLSFPADKKTLPGLRWLYHLMPDESLFLVRKKFSVKYNSIPTETIQP